MTFGKKIKRLREEKGYTQTELGHLLGSTLKTISNYEVKNIRPRKRETYEKLAEIFEVDINYLLTDEDNLLLMAREKFGYQGAKEATALVEETVSLFAGGDLPEEDKDKLFQTIAQAYYTAKMENKKYGHKAKKD